MYLSPKVGFDPTNKIRFYIILVLQKFDILIWEIFSCSYPIVFCVQKIVRKGAIWSTLWPCGENMLIYQSNVRLKFQSIPLHFEPSHNEAISKMPDLLYSEWMEHYVHRMKQSTISNAIRVP